MQEALQTNMSGKNYYIVHYHGDVIIQNNCNYSMAGKFNGKNVEINNSSPEEKMPYYSSEQIWNKMLQLEKMLNKLIERDNANNLEEFSFNKTCKMLHIGAKKLWNATLAGDIKGRKISNKKSKTGFSFKFTGSAIYKYQNSGLYNPEENETKITYVESAESIAKKIFGSNKTINNKSRKR